MAANGAADDGQALKRAPPLTVPSTAGLDAHTICSAHATSAARSKPETEFALFIGNRGYAKILATATFANHRGPCVPRQGTALLLLVEVRRFLPPLEWHRDPCSRSKDDTRPLAGAARTARCNLRKPTSRTTLASLVVVDLSKAIVLDTSCT